MGSKKRIRIIISSGVVIILLVSAAVLMLYNLGIIGKTGFFAENSKGTGINTSSLPEVTLTFGLPGFKHAYSDEILNELQERAIKDLNVRLNFKWNDVSRMKTENMIKQWNESDTEYDAYCLADYLEIGADIRNALRDGLIMDIRELFPQYAPNYYKKFDQAELTSGKYEGKLGIVPCYMPGTIRRYAVVREDLMKKYNIPEINSYDDFEAYLNIVKQNESGITPLYLNFMNDVLQPNIYDTTLKLFAEYHGYVIVDFGLGIVYKWDDPEMKLMAWEQTPEYDEAVGRLIKWRRSGFCDKEGKYFSFSKYASVIANKSDLHRTTRNASIGSNYDFKFDVMQLYPEKISRRTTDINLGIAISAKSKNPERVLMFIEWLQAAQDNYDLLMYGIKGKNYVLYGEQIDFPKDGGTDELTYINWSGHWSFLNFENERINLMFPPDFKKNYFEELRTKSKFAPHSGCIFDIEPVKDVAAQRVSSFCTVEEAIRTGSYTDKTIDEYISDQKKREVGRLLSTLQKQLDDWKVENKK